MAKEIFVAYGVDVDAVNWARPARSATPPGT